MTDAQKQFKLWFFRDLSSAQRLALFRLIMPDIPARQLETHIAQASGLAFVLSALHPSIGDSEAGAESSLRNVQRSTSGLSPFAGWQDYQHQREACAAVFRDGWSMEDENTLIDLVTRTWPQREPRP